MTDLETLLGVIVACLPLFPSSFRKLLRSGRDERDGSSSRKNWFSHTSVSRLLRSQRSATKNDSTFRRFNDIYLLTDVEQGPLNSKPSSLQGVSFQQRKRQRGSTYHTLKRTSSTSNETGISELRPRYRETFKIARTSIHILYPHLLPTFYNQISFLPALLPSHFAYRGYLEEFQHLFVRTLIPSI